LVDTRGRQAPLEELANEPERELGLEPRPARAEHVVAAFPRALAGRLEERRLPDTCRSLKQKRALGTFQQHLHRSELALPVEQLHSDSLIEEDASRRTSARLAGVGDDLIPWGQGQTYPNNGSGGNVIHVPLWGNCQIDLTEGPFSVLNNNCTNGNALFQLP